MTSCSRFLLGSLVARRLSAASSIAVRTHLTRVVGGSHCIVQLGLGQGSTCRSPFHKKSPVLFRGLDRNETGCTCRVCLLGSSRSRSLLFLYRIGCRTLRECSLVLYHSGQSYNDAKISTTKESKL